MEKKENNPFKNSDILQLWIIILSILVAIYIFGGPKMKVLAIILFAVNFFAVNMMIHDNKSDQEKLGATE